MLGVHATTLAARWERLRASGVSWITAHLIGDPQQMCLAFVAVDCEMHRREEVTARLAEMPEIVTVEEAASNRDLMLTVITPSLDDFSMKVISRLKEIEGLLKYQTALCTRLHASGGAWRLNVLSRAQRAAMRAMAGPEATGVAQRRRPGSAAGEPSGAPAVPGQGRTGHGGGHRPRGWAGTPPPSSGSSTGCSPAASCLSGARWPRSSRPSP